MSRLGLGTRREIGLMGLVFVAAEDSGNVHFDQPGFRNPDFEAAEDGVDVDYGFIRRHGGIAQVEPAAAENRHQVGAFEVAARPCGCCRRRWRTYCNSPGVAGVVHGCPGAQVRTAPLPSSAPHSSHEAEGDDRQRATGARDCVVQKRQMDLVGDEDQPDQHDDGAAGAAGGIARIHDLGQPTAIRMTGQYPQRKPTGTPKLSRRKSTPMATMANPKISPALMVPLSGSDAVCQVLRSRVFHICSP